MDLNTLAKQIKACKKCPLWRARKNAVPGEGPAKAKIFFLGEAPGKQEDELGRPFVGMAGRFLDAELEKADLQRHSIFITGTVKCRPPRNRNPKQNEIVICLPYTLKQLEIIKPRVTVLAGNVAVQALLGKKYSVSKDHGKIISEKGRWYFIMPHPAAAMRFPRMKKVFRQDLQKLKKTQ